MDLPRRRASRHNEKTTEEGSVDVAINSPPGQWSWIRGTMKKEAHISLEAALYLPRPSHTPERGLTPAEAASYSRGGIPTFLSLSCACFRRTTVTKRFVKRCCTGPSASLLIQLLTAASQTSGFCRP